MDFRAIRRAVIALAAAYSMALQALLLAFAVPQAAAFTDPLNVLCANIGTGDSGVSAKHEVPCPAICAAMGHGLAGALPAGFAVIGLLREAVAWAVSLTDWIAPLLFAASPLLPRGPPVA